MKKRILSTLLTLCMVLTLFPVSALATDNIEMQSCTCEVACAAEAMNADCPVCGAEGATIENCGKYEAPVEETEPEQTAIEKVQALINALPDADTITEENRADVEAQLTAIDEAKFPLEDEWDALDFTKYNDAIAALNELDGIGGAEIPEATAEATAESYFVFDKNTGTITDVTNDLPTEIVIPDTIDGVAVTAIGNSAFRECSGLTSITIPNSVTTIGENAFRNCSGLTSITIPNSVETIGYGAFRNCSGLTSITISNSVETIGEEAFRECYGLTSITIPNSVETIGYGAFRECDGLTSITISSKVTSIDTSMFSKCDSLTQINIDDGNTVYTSIDGVVFSKDKSKIIIVPKGINGAYTIPNSVTTIEAGAFEGCRDLTNITIPKGVKTIGEVAFTGCWGLTSIIIPDGVETIAQFAFYGDMFSSVIIPSSVKTIEKSAFDGCRNLANAYYLGTNEEWNVLIPNIGRDNLWLTNVVKCIAYNKSVNLVYDGKEKEVYKSQTDGVTIKYYQGTNEVSPINAGTYTAKVGNDEIGTFEIKKTDQVAPNGLADTAETIDGKADGKIIGVTTAMEYRKDGDTDYTAITGTEITGLADGKYYVRYKADDNHNASTDAEVTIAVGRKLTVTVPTAQVGYTLTVNKTELVWNDSVELTFALADGYSKLDTFAVNVNRNPITLDANGKYTVTNAQSDIAITVVGVVEVFTITFDPNGGTVDPTSATTDVDGKLTELPTPTRSGSYRFDGWFTEKNGGTAVTVDTVYEAHTTVYAHWTYTGSTTPDYCVIKATAGEGGSITPSGRAAVLYGASKTFTITPDDGYAIADVKVDGKSVGAVKTYTFERVRGDHTIEAVFMKATGNPQTGVDVPFTDVSENDWFYEDVAYVYANDLMKGTSETTFSPAVTTTRGMIVTILYRLEGEPTVSDNCPFEDVKSGSYYEKAITWAAANEIVGGYGNGKFGPDDPITREQMATILYRYTQYKGMDVSVGEDTNILSYNDAQEISEYAFSAMQWICGESILNGSDGNLMPQGNATRAQVAAILHRFCENILK